MILAPELVVALAQSIEEQPLTWGTVALAVAGLLLAWLNKRMNRRKR